jgi:hypothetical protein
MLLQAYQGHLKYSADIRGKYCCAEDSNSGKNAYFERILT